MGVTGIKKEDYDERDGLPPLPPWKRRQNMVDPNAPVDPAQAEMVREIMEENKAIVDKYRQLLAVEEEKGRRDPNYIWKVKVNTVELRALVRRDRAMREAKLAKEKSGGHESSISTRPEVTKIRSPVAVAPFVWISVQPRQSAVLKRPVAAVGQSRLRIGTEDNRRSSGDEDDIDEIRGMERMEDWLYRGLRRLRTYN